MTYAEQYKVARWTNSLGEEMASRVITEFSHGYSHFYVVHDWREGSRGHGFIVKEHKDVTIHLESYE